VNPYPPPPGVGRFVASKAFIQFDRTATERLKPFFSLISASNRVTFLPSRACSIALQSRINFLELCTMPHGYYLAYVATCDSPYWHYGFGQLPKPPAGTIPKGGLVYLQRPPDTLGTHQSGYLYGVGRILVKIGTFQPAPALVTDN
jgi:hypothetical protein